MDVKKLARYTLYLYIITIPYFAIVYGRIARLIFLLFTACAFLSTLSVGDIDLRRPGKVLIFTLGLLVLTGITYTYAKNRYTVGSASWTLIQLLIFDVLLAFIVDEESVVINCLKAYTIGTFIMIMFVLRQTGLNFLTVLPTWRFGQGDDALNVNSIGSASAWTVLISFSLYRREHKLLYIFQIVFFSLFVVASASRASLLIVIIGILLFMLFSGQKTAVLKVILAGAVMVGIYITAKKLNLFPDIIKRFDQLLNLREGINATDGSTRVRYEIVMYGIQEIKKKPILGYGLGQFAFITEEGYALAPHNAVIQIGYAFGVVGLLWWYGAIISSIYSQMRYGKSFVGRVMVVVCCALVFMSISSHALSDKTAHLFISLLLSVPCESEMKETNDTIGLSGERVENQLTARPDMKKQCKYIRYD